MNWRTINKVIFSAALAIFGSAVVALTSMYVYCVLGSNIYNDRTAFSIGTFVFLLTLTFVFLKVYNNLNPFRMRAKRKKRTERSKPISVAEAEALDVIFRQEMRKAYAIPISKANKYDLPL